jgi:adenine-specific DNA-methyltransferase
MAKRASKRPVAGRGTKAGGGGAAAGKRAESYRHPEAASVLRPDVGVQAQFRKKKPAQRYRYDSSLAPALNWDGQNPGREIGEWLLGLVRKAAELPEPHVFAEPQVMRWGEITIEVRSLGDAVDHLERLSRPFLDWAGKAERLSFDVPTLPLFVHERLSTRAILETLKGHKRDKQLDMFQLFADPQRPVHDQVLRAYEYPDEWVNRLVLGDSLVVMNSLLHYEGLGGQVQMIYMDPPYGVKFGSNFQPFVRRRDVKHNDDGDMTREPEMVKAYRDTWEVGLHSYLSYMRDRLVLARDLLDVSGSIFVQISDENVHHVRELLDEVFGTDNFCSLITFTKAASQSSTLLASVNDYILWYARERGRTKYRHLYRSRAPIENPNERYVCVEDEEGRVIDLSVRQKIGEEPMPRGRILRLITLTSQTGTESSRFAYEFEGHSYFPHGARGWSTSREGLDRVKQKGRMFAVGRSLRYKNYHDDFPYRPAVSLWDDVRASGFGESRLYVVQTLPEAVQRCLLMTTDPGDLVLDPTCGSGTTAYVAEQWGRRWITIDTSRVPLALARQRLLTATFPYHQLKEEARGPVGGFVYARKQNQKGEEVGGIVPHVTLKSIANDEPPEEEVLVDRPESEAKITRVSGPFTLEATIPTPVDWEGDGEEDSGAGAAEAHGSFVDRMLEVLRRSPVLHLPGNRTVTLHHVRRPAKTLSLSAEAVVARNGARRDEGKAAEVPVSGETSGAGGVAEPRVEGEPVALVFGPESGAVSEKLVWEAAREAAAKRYTHLYVIGFAIQPNARELIEQCDAAVGVAATYVQATPDLMMADLLKNTRSSQIFSVCGLPDVCLSRRLAKGEDRGEEFTVELRGLDVFDPATMENDRRGGDDVPVWLLDTDYNGLCFHVCQAFFPRTAAWDDLRRSLKGEFDDAVWEHLAGTTSAPFSAGESGAIAVKVIDDRGNELMVVKKLEDAEA